MILFAHHIKIYHQKVGAVLKKESQLIYANQIFTGQ